MNSQAEPIPNFDADPQLFFTSLVDQETKPHGEVDHYRRERPQPKGSASFEALCATRPWVIPPASATETAFRHGGWLADRQKVQAAMRAAAVPASRCERFDNCGSDCVAYIDTETHEYSLRANYCHDRLCVPCSRARARNVQEKLLRAIGSEKLRFLTLTLEVDDRSLADRLDFILASFVRLRAQKQWKKAVTAGAYFIEITRGKEGTHWHVHIHALITGSYLPQADIVEMWRKASKGSYIVDIRKVADTTEGVRYVAKYATKGVSHDVMHDADALTEAVKALVGRRLLGTFGKWRNLGELDVSVDYGTKKRVGRLDDIAAAALMGETWAIAVMTNLGRKIEKKGDRTGLEPDG